MTNNREHPEIDEIKLREEMEKGTKKLSPDDIEDLLHKKEKFYEKTRKTPGSFSKMINQLKLLFEMIMAYWNQEYREIPWSTIAASLFAVLYFITPVDLVPDFIPVLGYVDDATVVALTIKLIQDDMKKYCAHKGYDREQYF